MPPKPEKAKNKPANKKATEVEQVAKAPAAKKAFPAMPIQELDGIYVVYDNVEKIARGPWRSKQTAKNFRNALWQYGGDARRFIVGRHENHPLGATV